MPDDAQNPQAGQTPNAARIQAMLNDLAAQRAQAAQSGSTAPAGAPVNLPVAPAPRQAVPAPAQSSPQVPPPAPRPPASVPPVPPLPPRVQLPPATPPVVSAPSGAPALGVVPIARPAPAPAPRELPVIATPRPAPPPPPPPQPVVLPVVSAIPEMPKQVAPEFVGQVRTMAADMGNLTVGMPPVPVKTVSPQGPLPSGPLPDRPAAPAPIQAPVIVAPPAQSGGSMGRKILWFVVGLLVLGLLGVLAVTVLKGRSQVAVPTPTPSALASVTRTVAPVRDLSSYFGTPSGAIARDQLWMIDSSRAEAFRGILGALVPAGKSGKSVAVSGVSGAGNFLDVFGTYWGGDGGSSRASVTSLGNDYAFIVFGQSELFDAEGLIVTNAPVEPRVIAIFELKDASTVRQSLDQWEIGGNIVSDLRYILDLDPLRATPATFADGTYRQIPIRYMNFPLADRSIDLALVLASNGKNYLVISGSRESMFWAIDTLTK